MLALLLCVCTVRVRRTHYRVNEMFCVLITRERRAVQLLTPCSFLFLAANKHQVAIYFEVPDGTPTPAPFLPPPATEAPVYLWPTPAPFLPTPAPFLPPSSITYDDYDKTSSTDTRNIWTDDGGASSSSNLIVPDAIATDACARGLKWSVRVFSGVLAVSVIMNMLDAATM